MIELGCPVSDTNNWSWTATIIHASSQTLWLVSFQPLPDSAAALRSSDSVGSAYMYHVSPDYLRAEGTTLILGRAFTFRDDKDSPRVAVVNAEFARKVFGSVEKAIGGYYKLPDGTRIEPGHSSSSALINNPCSYYSRRAFARR